MESEPMKNLRSPHHPGPALELRHSDGGRSHTHPSEPDIEATFPFGQTQQPCSGHADRITVFTACHSNRQQKIIDFKNLQNFLESIYFGPTTLGTQEPDLSTSHKDSQGYSCHEIKNLKDS